MTHPSTESCYIQNIGVAVPERWLSSESGAALLGQGYISPRSVKLFHRIARLTGIEKRHLAALDDQVDSAGNGSLYRPATVQPQGPGMSERTRAFDKGAGPLVLRALGVFPPSLLSDVQALITVSCTHASSPGLDRPILSHTPVPAHVDRWNLGFMGCSAGLAGLRLVHHMAGSHRTALVVACELSSLHFQYDCELDQMTANALFADGAAAVLIGPRPAPVRIVACRCAALPSKADQMLWFASDQGLRLHLAQELPDTLAEHLPTIVSSFLQQCGLTRNDVQHWLAHPGGPQILDAVEASMRLPADALHLSRSVLRQYGNMSSPTIFFILKDLMAAGVTGRALALAFGPGLTIELTLLQIEENAR